MTQRNDRERRPLRPDRPLPPLPRGGEGGVRPAGTAGAARRADGALDVDTGAADAQRGRGHDGAGLSGADGAVRAAAGGVPRGEAERRECGRGGGSPPQGGVADDGSDRRQCAPALLRAFGGHCCGPQRTQTTAESAGADEGACGKVRSASGFADPVGLVRGSPPADWRARDKCRRLAPAERHRKSGVSNFRQVEERASLCPYCCVFAT
jgi:hypothetical protein